jgi:hypothetical protein
MGQEQTLRFPEKLKRPNANCRSDVTGGLAQFPAKSRNLARTPRLFQSNLSHARSEAAIRGGIHEEQAFQCAVLRH